MVVNANNPFAKYTFPKNKIDVVNSGSRYQQAYNNFVVYPSNFFCYIFYLQWTKLLFQVLPIYMFMHLCLLQLFSIIVHKIKQTFGSHWGIFQIADSTIWQHNRGVWIMKTKIAGWTIFLIVVYRTSELHSKMKFWQYHWHWGM